MYLEKIYVIYGEIIIFNIIMIAKLKIVLIIFFVIVVFKFILGNRIFFFNVILGLCFM